MATIHFTTTTTATPEQFIAGVTDFGPGRSAIFGNTDDSQLKVHDRGPTGPTSPRARARRGSACATTGQTRTASA